MILLEVRRRLVRCAARSSLLRELARSIARRCAGRHHVGVVAVVVDGTDVLMARHTVRPGWHLPGGWVRRREPPDAGAERELWEELGVRVRATDLLGCDVHAVGGRALRYGGLTLAYRCSVERAADAHPRSVEIDEVRWMPAATASAVTSGFERDSIAAALRLAPSPPGDADA